MKISTPLRLPALLKPWHSRRNNINNKIFWTFPKLEYNKKPVQKITPCNENAYKWSGHSYQILFDEGSPLQSLSNPDFLAFSRSEFLKSRNQHIVTAFEEISSFGSSLERVYLHSLNISILDYTTTKKESVILLRSCNCWKLGFVIKII